MNKSVTQEYLFESFLPYREGLNLARSLYGLLRLQKIILQGKDVEEQILERVSFNMRHNFPELKPYNMSDQEFSNLKNKEAQRKNMSKEEINEMLEQESEDIRKKIESGEIDIWDDSPKFIDNKKALEFLHCCYQTIEKKILQHCNSKESFLEKMTAETMKKLAENINIPNQKSNKEKRKDTAGLQALIMLWDYGKIAYEKEPPYKIMFSKQVAEALGIDPIMESIKLEKLRPLSKEDKRKVKTMLKICKTHKPWEDISTEEIEGILQVALRKKEIEQPFDCPSQ
jgi:hypothetical protein